MALEGQLSEFNLAEIFQLIAGQQKTGFLVLEDHTQTVFVFDKGILVSTRDRRTESEDPLQKYLRNYGFFDKKVWNHIEFVRKNSSLDLTEILISEKIVSEKELIRILQSLAYEMTHKCMKLKRGRYHFTPTRETPQGVRGRIQMNVQGVLMEAARRLDEEHKLKEAFPTPAVTFEPGASSPAEGDLSAKDRRLLELALSGESLAQILRQARLDAYTTRESLLNLCEEGYLQYTSAEAIIPVEDAQPVVRVRRPQTGLRSVPLTLLLLALLLAAGFWRWQPLLAQPPYPWGLTADSAIAEGDEAEGNVSKFFYDMRLRQIDDDLVQAIELFHYRHDKYPLDLSLLVKEELLAPPIYRTIFLLGWTYQLHENGDGYSLIR